MEDAGTIERLYKKLDEIEDKIEEIRLALIPEEEPTEEELKIIKEGRGEIKKGRYVKLEDALEILDE